ncbi:unnamed protein product [Protopolystoma xenopodis]|uniref:Uncharacterized protein n=1 Tax=Protopolystoma xenopodis TaxID=117903 RepID=A0A448WSX4_9PLAT|nr:unnamed protein product [Protopolystoma xenopodis]
MSRLWAAPAQAGFESRRRCGRDESRLRARICSRVAALTPSFGKVGLIGSFIWVSSFPNDLFSHADPRRPGRRVRLGRACT